MVKKQGQSISGRIRTVAGEQETVFPVQEMAGVKAETPSVVLLEQQYEAPSGAIVAEITAVPVCPCKGYEGQNYFCEVHEAKVECPKCHCIEAELEVPNKMPSVTNFRCRVCGIFYTRTDETGDIQY